MVLTEEFISSPMIRIRKPLNLQLIDTGYIVVREPERQETFVFNVQKINVLGDNDFSVQPLSEGQFTLDSERMILKVDGEIPRNEKWYEVVLNQADGFYEIKSPMFPKTPSLTGAQYLFSVLSFGVFGCWCMKKNHRQSLRLEDFAGSFRDELEKLWNLELMPLIYEDQNINKTLEEKIIQLGGERIIDDFISLRDKYGSPQSIHNILEAATAQKEKDEELRKIIESLGGIDELYDFVDLKKSYGLNLCQMKDIISISQRMLNTYGTMTSVERNLDQFSTLTGKHGDYSEIDRKLQNCSRVDALQEQLNRSTKELERWSQCFEGKNVSYWESERDKWQNLNEIHEGGQLEKEVDGILNDLSNYHFDKNIAWEAQAQIDLNNSRGRADFIVRFKNPAHDHHVFSVVMECKFSKPSHFAHDEMFPDQSEEQPDKNIFKRWLKQLCEYCSHNKAQLGILVLNHNNPFLESKKIFRLSPYHLEQNFQHLNIIVTSIEHLQLVLSVIQFIHSSYSPDVEWKVTEKVELIDQMNMGPLLHEVRSAFLLMSDQYEKLKKKSKQAEKECHMMNKYLSQLENQFNDALKAWNQAIFHLDTYSKVNLLEGPMEAELKKEYEEDEKSDEFNSSEQ